MIKWFFYSFACGGTVKHYFTCSHIAISVYLPKTVAPFQCFEVAIKYLLIKSLVTSTPNTLIRNFTKLFSSCSFKLALNTSTRNK